MGGRPRAAGRAESAGAARCDSFVPAGVLFERKVRGYASIYIYISGEVLSWVLMDRRCARSVHGAIDGGWRTHGYSRVLTGTHGYSQVLKGTHGVLTGYSQVLTGYSRGGRG